MANTNIANLTLADDTCPYFRIFSAKTDEHAPAREIGREISRSPSDAMQAMNILDPVISRYVQLYDHILNI